MMATINDNPFAKSSILFPLNVPVWTACSKAINISRVALASASNALTDSLSAFVSETAWDETCCSEDAGKTVFESLTTVS